MAFAVVMNFHSVSEEEYSALLGQLELDHRMPSGMLFHAAGPTMVGWRVMEAWESQEAFDAFYHEGLESALRKAGIEDPEIEHWTLYSTLILEETAASEK